MTAKNTHFLENISSMEPMLPDQNDTELTDLAFDLIAKSGSLAAQLHPRMQESIADLVRSMNCYYSNLIEGHNTHPRDIERALAAKFSDDPEKRNLQLEAKAHIHVQAILDIADFWQIENIISQEFIVKLHQEFCELLPEEFLLIRNFDTNEDIKIIPGKFRDTNHCLCCFSSSFALDPRFL